MSAGLPAWASTPAARALLDAILADPPETFVRRASIMGPSDEKFSASTPSGKLFYRLRRMHREWHERQLHALDTQFHVTGVWCDDASRALHATEDATALVRRLLDEASEDREAA